MGNDGLTSPAINGNMKAAVFDLDIAALLVAAAGMTRPANQKERPHFIRALKEEDLMKLLLDCNSPGLSSAHPTSVKRYFRSRALTRPTSAPRGVMSTRSSLAVYDQEC